MALHPVSYDSLKCVLQYMEPNKRFQVAHHCPSTRTAERAIPLIIDHLEFKNGEILVNEATYKIGICQKYKTGEEPESVKLKNMHGGVPYEVDEFGEQDRSDKAILTPGDVKIGSPELIRRYGEEPEIDPNEEIADLKHTIEEYTLMISEAGDRFGSFHQKQLEQCRIKLCALEYQQDNGTPPFEHYIKLIVDISPGHKSVEKYVYNRKYSEAMKQLGEYLFGGRRVPVHVRHFKLTDDRQVLRLPFGTKFSIQELRFSSIVGETLDALSPIIHESSYPLKHLAIVGCGEQDAAHQVVQGAQVLNLNIGYIFPLLTNISNKVVHIQINPYAIFNVNLLIDLINLWIERRQEVGTEFSFFHMFGAESMAHIRNHFDFEGAVILDDVLHIPMTQNVEIRVENTKIFEFNKNEKPAVTISVNAVDN